MIPVTEHMKDLLVKEGVGVFASTDPWGIYISDEPPTPDNCITLYDVPGGITKSMDSSRHFYASVFQVRVRADDYLAGWNKTEEARTTLDRYTTTKGQAKVSLIMDNIRYDNVMMSNEPLPLGKDSSERFLFVINGTAFRQETPSQEKGV